MQPTTCLAFQLGSGAMLILLAFAAEGGIRAGPAPGMADGGNCAYRLPGDSQHVLQGRLLLPDSCLLIALFRIKTGGVFEQL